MDLMAIQKIEYQITIDIWTFYQKWLKKMPIKIEDWRTILDEANNIVIKYEKYEQKSLNGQVNATVNRLEIIDKNIRFKKEAYE